MAAWDEELARYVAVKTLTGSLTKIPEKRRQHRRYVRWHTRRLKRAAICPAASPPILVWISRRASS
ncbi:hypothetical protein GCM10022245_24130 [Streptomyces mayteni]